MGEYHNYRHDYKVTGKENEKEDVAPGKKTTPKAYKGGGSVHASDEKLVKRELKKSMVHKNY